VPVLFMNLSEGLGRIEPHKGRFQPAFEAALFFRLPAPWETVDHSGGRLAGLPRAVGLYGRQRHNKGAPLPLQGGPALGECPLKVVKALEGERALHPLSLPLTIMI
jgi:hypothetical protein